MESKGNLSRKKGRKKERRRKGIGEETAEFRRFVEKMRKHFEEVCPQTAQRKTLSKLLCVLTFSREVQRDVQFTQRFL